ncbi:MAG: hypothetical protein OXC07_09515, partial [Kistimonas sp.]|nr:hypothetical protein [Kistimonas sp.]
CKLWIQGPRSLLICAACDPGSVKDILCRRRRYHNHSATMPDTRPQVTLFQQFRQVIEQASKVLTPGNKHRPGQALTGACPSQAFPESLLRIASLFSGLFFCRPIHEGFLQPAAMDDFSRVLTGFRL